MWQHQGSLYSHQVVIQFSPEVINIFAFLKMRKNSVCQKELCLPGRDINAQQGKKMQLPYHAGKGGFPALVGARYDENTFMLLEAEIIADNLLLFLKDDLCKREIESRNSRNSFLSRCTSGIQNGSPFCRNFSMYSTTAR